MHNSDVPLHGTTSNSWVPQQQKSLQMVNEYLRHMYQIYCYCLHELSHNGGSDETCLRFVKKKILQISFFILRHYQPSAVIVQVLFAEKVRWSCVLPIKFHQGRQLLPLPC
jgi:hypothetical protein